MSDSKKDEIDLLQHLKSIENSQQWFADKELDFAAYILDMARIEIKDIIKKRNG